MEEKSTLVFGFTSSITVPVEGGLRIFFRFNGERTTAESTSRIYESSSGVSAKI